MKNQINENQNEFLSSNGYTPNDLKEIFINQHHAEFLEWLVKFLQNEKSEKLAEYPGPLKPGVYTVRNTISPF